MAVLRLVPTSGAPVPVEIRDVSMVGRDPGCELVVSDGSVSRRHARIEPRGGGWAVVDQGSANGTFVDSQRVSDVELRDGQQLRFGAIAYRVEIEGDDAGATVVMSEAGMPEATVMQPAVLPPPGPSTPPWSAPSPPPAPRPDMPPAPPSPPQQRVAPPPKPGPTGAPPPPPRMAGGPPPPPPPPPMAGGGRPMGAPPMGAGAPPPRRTGRSPWVYAGGGCCGCLVLGVLAFVVIGALGGGAAFFATSAPVEAARKQLAEIKSGDMASAYTHMSEEYRAAHGPSDFAAFVDRHPALKSSKDSTFTSRNVMNDTATLVGFLDATTGEKETVSYSLKKEGEAWRITDLTVAGESILTGGGGSGGGGSGGLTLESGEPEKTMEGAVTVVVIRVRVTGYGTDDDNNVNLALDLETMGPGGNRIPQLSRRSLQSIAQPVPDPSTPVDFTARLQMRGFSDGSYVAKLTVRDEVGRSLQSVEVPFSLP